ncbi:MULTISPECIES: glycosyltransferase family 2 protein [unclassified Desulfovibrio]|uniref:glycosyltransferase family 2 protein n=1 Tax=unclassified Desulfovibrio TaxID=2593640 RepID=UPI000F5E3F1E|nr:MULTISPECIES: glycosyltransferase family 2 protein [unclassified Desulfovibrio]RRD71718.1 glycosyltransferase family 2 protein [Desulfovibrio sp. OH1209_COT-279]RRD87931.1 glycosyltransferase family 2 protein [Desulfovibrio sp. OH1186_COT-070]
MPEVTVIIPAYNAAPWLADTLRSVQEQDFTNFSCIVVDDGSTDATAEIFARGVAHDSRFLLVRQAHAGVCAARNAGMELVQTPLVAMLDSDDIWHCSFLRRMVHALAKPGVRLACCRYALFHDKTCLRKPQAWINIHATGNIWWDMLLDSVFCMGAWVARTADTRMVGAFAPSLACAEDRDFLLRLLAYCAAGGDGSMICIPEELLFYRQRRESAVRTTTQPLETEWTLMSEHLEHPSVPPTVRRRGYSFLAFKMAVIAACAHHDLKAALRWYAKAVVLCPANMNLYLLPLRKLMLSLSPPQKLPWLCSFLSRGDEG